MVEQLTTTPLIHVPIKPITTMRKSLIKNAVQQIKAPPIDTDMPMSKYKYLLIILAKISKPPEDAFTRNNMVWQIDNSNTPFIPTNAHSIPLFALKSTILLQQKGVNI